MLAFGILVLLLYLNDHMYVAQVSGLFISLSYYFMWFPGFVSFIHWLTVQM